MKLLSKTLRLYFFFVLALSPGYAQSGPRTWLDSPLANWNKPNAAIPRAPALSESNSAVINRCKLTPPRSTAAERAVEGAGWIPFWNFDQQLIQGDVEIVGGMRGADGMCRPSTYNLFVFVGGKFAGLLSPTSMASRTDSSSGVVRMQPPGINAEFARFTSNDPACCPSSHVTVRYRIDRTPTSVLVVPTETRVRP